jgi:hypothetical protein
METSQSVATPPSNAEGVAVLTQPTFEHTPLDLRSEAIRLVRIRPLQNSDETIKCDLRLTSIDAKYTCLSYVWGHRHSNDWILVDGNKLSIHANLYRFLFYASLLPEFTSTWFWIDAICIDQNNITERQHQVQQMGRIFSKADEVISWLGENDAIKNFLCPASPRLGATNEVQAFSDSTYWARAWITQEIILARRVRLMACDKILPLKYLPSYHDDISVELTKRGIIRNGMTEAWASYESIRRRIQHMRENFRDPEKTGNALVYLLDHFQLQSCHIVRDRIFSLLGLCGDGANLKVDYCISNTGLALEVLTYCRTSFCLCALRTIAGALHVPSGFGNVLPGDLLPSTACAVLTLPITWRGDDHVNPSNVAWHDRDDYFYHNDELECPEGDPDSLVVYDPNSQSRNIRSRQFLRSRARSRIIMSINLHHICSIFCGRLIIEMQPSRVDFTRMHWQEHRGVV